jgi:hypothetical protein
MGVRGLGVRGIRNVVERLREGGREFSGNKCIGENSRKYIFGKGILGVVDWKEVGRGGIAWEGRKR